MQRFFLERTRTVKERIEFEFDANSNWSEIPIFFTIWGMHRHSLIRIYLTMHFCASSNSPSCFFNPRYRRLRVVNRNFERNKNVKIYSWIRLKMSGKKWPVHKLTCGYSKNKRQKIVGSFGFYIEERNPISSHFHLFF